MTAVSRSLLLAAATVASATTLHAQFAFDHASELTAEIGVIDVTPIALGTPIDLRLTLLHNNDGESQLIDAGPTLTSFGGVARFKTLADNLKAAALFNPGDGINRGVVMVSSGDNFIASVEFNASLQNGVPYFDGLALDRIGYDVSVLGNHEFDFGPDTLADFIDSFPTQPFPFISANLDFSGEPRLAAQQAAGRLARSVVITEAGEQIGFVGATTPLLATISSPRNVIVNPNVVGAIQAEVNALAGAGVNKIILLSHLQSLQEDLLLIPMLHGIDIVVAGGGDELLTNPTSLLIPGDTSRGPYPTVASDALANPVYVVTTAGDYRYIGRLVVDFDAAGNVLAVDASSGPVRVAGAPNPDAVVPDPTLQALVVDPVAASVAALAVNVIGQTQAPLDGVRNNVRTVETNLGNLTADAFLWQATQLAASFGAPLPQVGIQNGGGMRNNAIIPAGNVTELDTFSILPFGNFVSVVPNVSPAKFKEVLENAVSRVEFTDGRFAQIAGFRMTWDRLGTAQVTSVTGQIVTPGTRVRDVILADGSVIVANGAIAPGAPSVNIATIDFLARGGDQYPLIGLPFINLGVSYQQALRQYIESGLNGVVNSIRYPAGGEGRITRLN